MRLQDWGPSRFFPVMMCAIFLVWGASGPGTATAQTSTTGAIGGSVKGKDGKALEGVTVVVSSTVLQQEQAEMTAKNGRYRISNLPPGTYLIRFIYLSKIVERKGVVVPLGQLTVVNQLMDPDQSGEKIVITDRGSTVDPTSTNQGTSITQTQMRNIPIPGRTFASTLGQAAGAAGDSRGVAFSGSTSLENSYVIDGVNTTGLNYGTIGTPLINEFIKEIQVITGGYMAEYGRATGAVVNVITKQGSNEFHGDVFTTVTPYQVSRTPVRPVNSSIEGVSDLDYLFDFGFDLGGPIIKDKVWFYVGFAPQISRRNIRRIVKRQTDCREIMPSGELSNCDPASFGDGSIDEDPETGDPIYETVDTTQFKTGASTLQFVTKINFAPSAEHQGQFSLLGSPTSGQGIFGVTGAPSATRANFTGLNSDLAFKWTSKFNNNKTEVEFVAGWHRDKYDQEAIDPIGNALATTRVYLSNLDRFGDAGKETGNVMNGCRDSSSMAIDPYPQIENCPVFQYWLDSPGFIINNLEDRRSAQLKVTQRVKALGTHVIKSGVDVEANKTVDVRHFTGGRYNQLIPDAPFEQVRVYRYVRPYDGAPDVCGFGTNDLGSTDFNQPRTCEYLDTSKVTGRTFNWSAYLQDSWQPVPNVTLNMGVRYEEQRLRYAEQVANTIDPFTNERLGNNAIRLRNMWAPRFGAVWDWTKEGRAKVYISAGRFYESIPMALNDFSFSGDTLYGAFFGTDQCENGNNPSQDRTGSAPNPGNCPTQITQGTNPDDGEVYRGGTTLVTPGTKAQYMDELVLGVQYELIEDFNVGVAFKTRRLGRVLEDVSIDNAETYIIGNPGHFDADDERRLQRELDGLDPMTDEYKRLAARLEGYRALRRFDKPRRDYNAIELTATKRFSKSFYIQASYTYSRTEGNYPGLLNDDTGSALPNISTQYDLVELLANRDGPLPQDRPHYFKFDGYYTHQMQQWGALTAGVRFRALSGTPVDALGSNLLYGFGESYLLPRGATGRTEFVTGTDFHLGYARKLAKGYEMSVFFDVINVFNQEQVARVDELYTFDNVNPVVGGDAEDLVFAKSIGATGSETSTPLTRNVGYGTPLARYTPLYIRFGARLTF